jgi:hypothetical protein
MRTTERRLSEPGGPGASTFVEALLGVMRVLRKIDNRLAGPEFAEDAASSPGEREDEVVDALLGLLSVRRTVGLLVEALFADGEASGPAASSAEARWSREVLR